MSEPTTSATKATTKLSTLIEQTGFTQYQVARQLGLSPNTIYSWCRGLARPWRTKAYRLSTFLGISITELMLAWQAGVPKRRRRS
jgi:transcriptional regulator with XRE-family HTH domain